MKDGTRERTTTSPLRRFPKGAAGACETASFGRLLFSFLFIPFTHWPFSETMTNWVSDDPETGGPRV